MFSSIRNRSAGVQINGKDVFPAIYALLSADPTPHSASVIAANRGPTQLPSCFRSCFTSRRLTEGMYLALFSIMLGELFKLTPSPACCITLQILSPPGENIDPETVVAQRHSFLMDGTPLILHPKVLPVVFKLLRGTVSVQIAYPCDGVSTHLPMRLCSAQASIHLIQAVLQDLLFLLRNTQTPTNKVILIESNSWPTW